MKRYLLVMLFVLTTSLSFFAGFYIANNRRGQNTSVANLNPIYCRNIKESDIKSLSSPKQFSGRMMYHDGQTMDRDIVPNETIAVKLGLLLLESDFGSDVYKERPYNVALLDSVWVVETSFNPSPLEMDSSKIDPDMEVETLMFGGVGHVEINRHNGKVYTIYHTK